jgi:hypothetical protein
MSCQLHVLAALTERVDPNIYWLGGWVGPRTGFNTAQKRQISCNLYKVFFFVEYDKKEHEDRAKSTEPFSTEGNYLKFCMKIQY